MPRHRALIGSMMFFLIAPGIVAGLIPWLLSRWTFGLDYAPGLAAVGIVLIVVGLAPLLDSFVRFAWTGLGTPAPFAPPSRLVASGFYRHVRNPMYLGVVAIVWGQALLFADATLIAYGLGLWFAMYAFVVNYEEPRLRQTFGADYETFCANVPSWLPRLTPWKG